MQKHIIFTELSAKFAKDFDTFGKMVLICHYLGPFSNFPGRKA